MKRKKLNQKWLKAAVLGSVWAAFEIVVGSFLHNLKIPFSGTFLSAASVFLLVAFMQIWKEPGIIIRAGLICALMKSISPSAFIFGPMIGIFLEAFLLEYTSRLLGRNLLAYTVAGALAVSSTLLQKAGMLLVHFGYDLVAITKPFYFYLVKITGWEDLNPRLLIVSIFGIYSLIGLLSAVFGYFSGKNYLKNPISELDFLSLTQKDERRFSIGADAQNKNPLLKILILITAMIGSMWLINISFLYGGLIAGVVYISLILFRYKKALGRLKKGSLWIQFALITLIAAVFLEWVQTGYFFSYRGLMVGLKMNFRALIIIMGFSAISIELRSPIVKTLLTKKGFSALYNSLNLSFSALPALIGALPSGKNFTKDTRNIIPNILAKSEGLLLQFNERNEQFDHIYIITGGVHEGKTTFAQAVVEALKKQKVSVEGFLAHGTFSGNRRHSFQIENIKSQQKHLLCIREIRKEWANFGSFSFDPSVLRRGNDLLKNITPSSVVLIDEVGRFEFREKEGWFEGLSHLLHHHPTTQQIWVVRRDFIPELQALFPIPEAHIFDITHANPKELIKLVTNSNTVK